MTLIDSNKKAMILVNRYWKASNSRSDWDYLAALLMGAAVVSEYELSLELFDLADIARYHGTMGVALS